MLLKIYNFSLQGEQINDIYIDNNLFYFSIIWLTVYLLDGR